MLYALNYKNDKGFLLLSGAHGTLPILAHSEKGSLYFKNIGKDNPLHSVLENYKNQAKEIIKNPTSKNLEYYNLWKDLGNEKYEYTIVPSSEPTADGLKVSARRDFSTGKETIYPYTGKELDVWGQYDDYNKYAPNQAAIGCPSVAIGMLLYDLSNRMLGDYHKTEPSFSYSDRFKESASEVSQKLKQIADSIPNYKWGKYKNAESGASPEDILKGLKKLGFPNAKMRLFDLDVLYNNLKVKKSYGESGQYTVNRGGLIGAYNNNAGGGHIWFCDGYYEQSYKVEKKFLWVRVKTWTEYDDRLYMNWGWGTKSLESNGKTANGWYSFEGDSWNSLEGKRDKSIKRGTLIFTDLDYKAERL